MFKTVPHKLIIPCLKLLLHDTIFSTMLLVMKREIFMSHCYQQSLLKCLKAPSGGLARTHPSRGVIDVTQQQLRSLAVRAAGLAASVCGSTALLPEVQFLTSHQSEGAWAQQLAAGLPDKWMRGLGWWCITIANGLVSLWPFAFTVMTSFLFLLLSYSQTWLQRGL